MLGLYERKLAKGCVALDDGATFDNYKFTEYEWLSIGDFEPALRPVGPFIVTMESTDRVTCSLALPMIYSILHATSSAVHVHRYVYDNGELTDNYMKEADELSSEVQDLRRMLHIDNKEPFITNEKIGHKED